MNSSSEWSGDSLIMPDLTPEAQAWRDKFVTEYLVDRNPTRAAIRVGYSPSFAPDIATQFMREPYVLREIERRSIASVESRDDPADLERARKRIISKLWTEVDAPGGSQAARVAALKQLSVIYGIEAAKKSEQTVTHKGGVMMVPAMLSVSEWENAARQQQEQLQNDARLH